ncbi:MAG: PKD domain-containing protein [Thermoplasmata archaeon]
MLGGPVIVATILNGPPYATGTFLLADGHWRLLKETVGAAPSLGGGEAAYVPDLGALVLQGGLEFGPTGDISGATGLTWELNGTVWRNVTAATGAGPDGIGTALWVDADGSLVAFGGVSDQGEYSNALWILSIPPRHTAVSLSPDPTDRRIAVTLDIGSAGGAPPITSRVNWGDGSPPTTASQPHGYSFQGRFTVQVLLTDALGRTAVGNAVEVVNPDLTLLNISIVPYSSGHGGIPFRIKWEGGVGPYRFVWNFGDGSTSTSPAPTHTFAQSGIYEIYVKVTDSLGEVSTMAMSLTVPAPPGSVAFAITVAGPPLVGAAGVTLLLVDHPADS